MKLRNLFFLVITFSTLVGCESKKLKNEAEIKAQEFFKSLKKGDEKSLYEIYDGFANFNTFYKSDSAVMQSSEFKDGIVKVFMKNKFTNGLGKLTEKDIYLFFKKDSLDKLVLFDSKGLSDFSELNDFKFGNKTGCITKKDTSDQQILSAMKKSHEVLMDKAIEVYLQLKKEVKVSDWNWETLYSGSASGKGIVTNNSTFNIPSIKYTITYKTSSGTIITEDKGTITYDVLNAGSSTSFSFYSDYVGNASRASIDLNFDDDMILDYLADKVWTGKECEEFFK